MSSEKEAEGGSLAGGGEEWYLIQWGGGSGSLQLWAHVCHCTVGFGAGVF